MKVYIKKFSTGRYLKSPNTWTSDQSEALCFKNSLTALDFCFANHIGKSVILINFGDPKYDIELQVRGKDNPASSRD